MGGGTYTDVSYKSLFLTKGYDKSSREQIFVSRHLDSEMNPKTITIRESRDSEEHPNSLAIIIGLDETGSMGFLPEHIVKTGLPKLMDSIIQAGILDPQILFMGIGDHVYDNAPIQVGQFESSAELLDRWLTKVYLEGNGGGNNFESYTLAWLMASRHTSIDCLEKRNQKGFLFTIGDEPINSNLPGETIKQLTTEVEAHTITSEELYEEVSKKYHVYHIHLMHDDSSKSSYRMKGWKKILGQNFITLENVEDLSKTVAQIITSHLDTTFFKNQDQLQVKESVPDSNSKENTIIEEML